MSRFAGLPAALKAASEAAKVKPEENEDTETPENEDEDDGSTPPTKAKGKDKDMAEADQNAAVETAKKEADAAGFKRASDRFSAVMASEHYEGREASAAKLLTKESLFNASADDIVDLMADMPKVERGALSEGDQREAAEEGGRKEMQEQLKKGANSNIDADAGKSAKKSAESAAVWDQAISSIAPDVRK